MRNIRKYIWGISSLRQDHMRVKTEDHTRVKEGGLKFRHRTSTFENIIEQCEKVEKDEFPGWAILWDGM